MDKISDRPVAVAAIIAIAKGFRGCDRPVTSLSGSASSAKNAARVA